MVLANFYVNEKKQEYPTCGFTSRSDGCSCCSADCQTEDEVKKEAIESLKVVKKAAAHFNWNVEEMLKEAGDD